jgi:hypothetical protein
MSNDETRYTELKVSVLDQEREAGSGPMTIAGYASTFNSKSRDLGGFIEVIAPGAFDNVLEDDVRAMFNHKPDNILGRVSSGTLRLSVDGTGLLYEVDLPNNTLGKDLFESVKRGDIKESSFRFGVAPGGEEWRDTDSGLLRTITKLSRLVDVSPVTFPAYSDSTIAVRSMEKWKKGNVSIHEKRCALLRIKLDS